MNLTVNPFAAEEKSENFDPDEKNNIFSVVFNHFRF